MAYECVIEPGARREGIGKTSTVGQTLFDESNFTKHMTHIRTTGHGQRLRRAAMNPQDER
jgi:hypothetical protein